MSDLYDFLHPIHSPREDANYSTTEQQVYSDLQEYASDVSLHVGLMINEKIPPREALKRVRKVWKLLYRRYKEGRDAND